MGREKGEGDKRSEGRGQRGGGKEGRWVQPSGRIDGISLMKEKDSRRGKRRRRGQGRGRGGTCGAFLARFLTFSSDFSSSDRRFILYFTKEERVEVGGGGGVSGRD